MVGTTPDKIENATSDEDAPCGICTGNITIGTKAVSCDECKRWLHQTCGKVSNQTYSRIEKAPKDKPYQWRCEDCKRSLKKKKIEGEHPQQELRNSKCTGPKSNITDDDVGQQMDIGLVIAQNERLKKVIEVLTDDRGKLTEQLKHANKQINFLNETLREKTEMITKLVNNLDSQLSQYPKDKPFKEMSSTGTDRPKETSIANEAVQDKSSDSETAEKEKSKKVKSLIIGDSILKGMQQKVTNPEVEVKCMPGARIQTLSRYLSTQETLPSTVVVHIGSNNLYNAKTPNHVMRPLWYTIESAQKRYKDTIWIVNGILHRGDIPRNVVEEVNEALMFMCEQLKVVYRDPNSAITVRGYGRDGVHLNPIGDQQLTDFILSDLGLECDGIGLQVEEKEQSNAGCDGDSLNEQQPKRQAEATK